MVRRDLRGITAGMRESKANGGHAEPSDLRSIQIVHALISDDVRVEVYRSFIEDGKAPGPEAIARKLEASVDDVLGALRELAADDVIAFRPGTEELWLAHPFCAGEAPFEVRAGTRTWDAICIWDALGILALLEADGHVFTRCPDCLEAMTVTVDGGRVVPIPGSVVHFGIPARRWYEDVGYT
jgi:hypothetical protein